MKGSPRKQVSLCLAIALLLLAAGVIQAHADPISFGVSGPTGGVTLVHDSGGGQYVSFSGLKLLVGDSAFNAPLAIYPGSGSFLFNNASTGGFAALNGAYLTMGNSVSGILLGTIDSIQVIGVAKGSSQTAFTLQLNLGSLSFQSCSTNGCSNSPTLQEYAHTNPGSASGLISFTLNNSTASTMAGLYGLTGTHNDPSESGSFSGEPDLALEPASLALFGTGLLICGIRICRPKKQLQA